MNSIVRTPEQGVSIIASPKTWLEGAAIQQLATTARLPGMVRVVGMPDLHPGRGYPVGAAFFSGGVVYPALVGNDIGCGMGLWQTDLPVARPKLDKLERRWASMEGPLEGKLADLLVRDGWSEHPHCHALGTVGGGNHFAELQRIDAVMDEAALAALGLTPRSAVLLVHSGSRGLGEEVLRRHVDRFGHSGLPAAGHDAAEYFAEHAAALRFAQANRAFIAHRTLDLLCLDGRPILDVDHNMVEPFVDEGRAGFVHRKGATPADRGPVVIPGSRGDHSYLVEPLDTPTALRSLAHGAGRKWGRSDCKGRLASRYRLEDLARTALGSRVICTDKELLFEEAPEAYKGIDGVVGDLVDSGLVRMLARMTPLITYKTRRGGCCP